MKTKKRGLKLIKLNKQQQQKLQQYSIAWDDYMKRKSEINKKPITAKEVRDLLLDECVDRTVDLRGIFPREKPLTEFDKGIVFGLVLAVSLIKKKFK